MALEKHVHSHNSAYTPNARINTHTTPSPCPGDGNRSILVWLSLNPIPTQLTNKPAPFPRSQCDTFMVCNTKSCPVTCTGLIKFSTVYFSNLRIKIIPCLEGRIRTFDLMLSLKDYLLPVALIV